MAVASKMEGKPRSTTRRQAVNRRTSKAQPKPKVSSPDYSIAAVDRALDLLEALARVGPAPLGNIAEFGRLHAHCGLSSPRTLQARGFAMQDEARGLWRLGARWGVLGRAAQDQGALAAAATPFLSRTRSSGGREYVSQDA